MRTDDYGVLQGFVAAGVGVALVPRPALGSPREDLVIRPVDGPELAREIGVAVLRTSTAGSAARLPAELRNEAERIRAGWRAGAVPEPLTDGAG